MSTDVVAVVGFVVLFALMLLRVPVGMAMGFDPIWFGVIIVMVAELGLIHPPVGMNIFVIKRVVEDAKISTIFYGVLPVHLHRHPAAHLAHRLCQFSALWLPSKMG